MMVKLLTQDELKLDPKHYAMVNEWLARGDGIAVYENEAMDSSQLGHRKFVSYGSADAQLETSIPPERMPDIGGQINWAYRLVGIYDGTELDEPEPEPEKEPVRMCMVYERLAALLYQRENILDFEKRTGEKHEWLPRVESRIVEVVNSVLHRTHLDLHLSTHDKLVFVTNQDQPRRVTVRGALWDKFTLTVSGRDRDGIKDSIHQEFYFALRELVPENG